MMNPDVLASLNNAEAVEGAYAVLDRIQHIKRPECQLAAILLCAMAAADAAGTRLPDVLSALDNLSRDSQRQLLPNVRAMREYWTKEVLSSA